MTPPIDEVSASIRAEVGGGDPLERWARLPDVEAHIGSVIKDIRAEIASDLYAVAKSWRSVGEALGVSTQRAHQIANRTR